MPQFLGTLFIFIAGLFTGYIHIDSMTPEESMINILLGILFFIFGNILAKYK